MAKRISELPAAGSAGDTDELELNQGGTSVKATRAQVRASAAETKTAYESNADTNAFDDAEQTKLAGIATGATNNTGALADLDTVGATEIDAGAVGPTELANTAVTPGSFSHADITVDAQGRLTAAANGAIAVTSVFGRTGAVSSNSGDYDDAEVTAAASATNYTPSSSSVDGHLSGIDTALGSAGAVASVFGRTDVVVAVSGDYDADEIDETASNKIMTAAERTKLTGIETGATADQTGAEIKTAYEGEADTNAFTDAEQTKLSGIATGATDDTTVDAHIADAVAAHAATAISNAPAGGIAATTVQAAIDELDSEKAASSHTHTLADVTDSGALAALATVDTAQIDNGAVTLAKMADIVTDSFIGRDTAGTGVPENLTVVTARAMLNVEDGANAPPFVTADYTDASVTYAKIQDVSAQWRVLGRISSGAGDIEEIDVSALTDQASPAGGDLILAERASDGALIHIQVGNLPTGGGGEANLGSNLGAGVGVFETKSGVTLQFNSLVSQTTALTIAEDDPNDEIDFTIANVIAAGAAGLMTGTDKTKLDGVATGATDDTTVDAHIADAVAAHDDSAIAAAASATNYTPGGSTVEGHLSGIDTALGTVGAVVSVFTRTGAVVAVAGDYTASEVTNVAAGDIVATTVQAAIDELDGEKVATSVTLTASTGLTGGGDLSANRSFAVDINGTADLPAPATGDELLLSDISDTNTVKKADLASIVNLADHDALTNFVADEHVAHAGVTLTAGDGLTGGGTIAASRTFDVDITGTTDLAAPAVADELLISDADNSNAIRKADVASVVNLADHDALTNFVADEHVAHAGVTITAGAGLSGGGTIAATRTIDVDINGTTDLPAPAVGDELLLGDVSDSNNIRKADLASIVNLADHDALTNFVANEHIDHTSVTLTAGDALSGGGDISSNRTFDVDINGTTDLAAPATGDEMLLGDISNADAIRKADVASVVNLADHDALTNFVADEHVAHAGVTLTAGDGLAGGGTIAASRTFDVDINATTDLAAPARGDELLISDISNADAIRKADLASIVDLAKPVESFIIAASDEATALTTGTAKVTFRMPYAFTLTEVRASVTTAPTGSVLTVDINEGGTTILSTKLTIDATETTSTTAATAAVISDSALADDAEITIDVDAIGSTIAGAGLKVTLIGNQA